MSAERYTQSHPDQHTLFKKWPIPLLPNIEEDGPSVSLFVVPESDEKTLPQLYRNQTHFQPRQQFADRHVVVPDLHGEYNVLERILDKYGEEPDINFAFLGDIIDRKGIQYDNDKGVFKTLELIKDLGNRAILTIANHEWYFMASSYADDPTLKQYFTKEWLGTSPKNSIEQNVLISYGMDPERRDSTTLEVLQRRMARAGHLGLIANASPYYETDSFIATHAGIMPGVPWEMQREYLTNVAEEMQEGLFYDRPPQWFSHKLASSTEEIHHTQKTVVSGHSHLLVGGRKRDASYTSERSIHNGKRIRLASTLNAPTKAPAFVWQDWDQQIIGIPNE